MRMMKKMAIHAVQRTLKRREGGTSLALFGGSLGARGWYRRGSDRVPSSKSISSGDQPFFKSERPADLEGHIDALRKLSRLHCVDLSSSSPPDIAHVTQGIPSWTPLSNSPYPRCCAAFYNIRTAPAKPADSHLTLL